MTTELTYLTWTMILTTSLWIPYIIGVNKYPQNDTDSFLRPAPLTGFPPWVHRSHRAHLNALETALPFAVLVLIAHTIELSNTVTVWVTALFFWLRVAHAVGMITGFARFPVRPILFSLGWLCTLVMAVEIILA